MFMNLNKGIKFDNDFLNQYNIDGGFLKVPMTVENLEIPKDLLEALLAILSQFRGIGKTNNRTIKNLINLL